MPKKVIIGVGLPAHLAQELPRQYPQDIFEFINCPSVEELLRDIKRYKIDLLFIYNDLPDLKNYEELCIALRSNAVLETVPVIVISKSDKNREEKIKMLNSGLIDGFTDSQTSPEELSAYASVFLQRRDLEEELEMKNQLLNAYSITDELTKLYNRRFLLQSLEQEISKMNRYVYHFSCIMFDVDYYKRINDTLGHAQGDSVLESLAEIIKKSIRSVDIACRYGGDEIVVIFPFTRYQSGIAAAERLRRKIEAHNFGTGDAPLTITISIGLISMEEKGTLTVDAFLRLLDQQLYQAKNSGRNKTCASLYKSP
ncbi:MAG TPA: diguanylate cyclase [Candidatus Omnitrophota bacterium]|nr:diguanylate cyclase [Candidatus Omnitrophota bacterium]HRZ14548.1 diguanylate cyclase [Candidatus Omnitrophota bacterium]